MKRTDIRKFFTKKKKAVAGCVAAAIVLAGGVNVWQSSQVPEFPDYTDPVMETTLTEDDTPLASQPKVTTKTTSNTKTTKKNVKLKKAATKTYTKKLPTTQKKSTSTKKTNSTTTVKTVKTVKTATTQKFTKKSKNVVQTQKVTTTVQTTTTVQAAKKAGTATKTASTASTAKSNTESLTMDSKYTVSNVASIAPQMDKRVLDAYTKLGFTVTVDPSVHYGGYFNARTRSITLRYEDDTIYHELGHFVAFVAGNADRSSSFVAIYNKEKSQLTGFSKSYATQNSSEYFADAMLAYVENPSQLKSRRPQTYAAIVEALNKLTDERIQKVQKIYGPYWK